MKKLFLVLTLAVLGLLGAAGAFATDGGFYKASLQPIPHDPAADGGSNVTGSAKMFVKGRKVTVDIHASGLTPALPHAMHIHGVLGDANVCPPATADESGDGLVSLEEGAPFYGPIDVSFTTSGDTSAASGLALERFPVAGADGNLDYHRTFTIPKSVAKDLTQLHIVLHGLDLNNSGDYNTLFEAVLPVACGRIRHHR